MVRLVEGLLAIVGLLLAGGSGPEVYHVDLEQALASSTGGRTARAELQVMQDALQAEAERREAEIVDLRKRAERSRQSSDRTVLARSIEAHAEATERAAKQLAERQERALQPMIDAARAVISKAQGDGVRVVVMEDAPLVAPPKACDRSRALSEALDARRPLALDRRRECQVRTVFLLGFDQAVKSSRVGVEAAKRVEELRARLQGELDEKRRRAEALPESERYSAELELAEQFRRNQDRLRAAEEDEEGRLFTQLARAIFRVSPELPEARFVDAAALEIPGVTICSAEPWSREVLDGGAGRDRLLEVCGLRPPG